MCGFASSSKHVGIQHRAVAHRDLHVLLDDELEIARLRNACGFFGHVHGGPLVDAYYESTIRDFAIALAFFELI
jgi:hypothetical protein